MGTDDQVKHFKARIEGLAPWITAIEVFFEADNIIEAGQLIMKEFMANGIETRNITRLIEIDKS